MNGKLHSDAMKIVSAAIGSVKPDEAVKRALSDFTPEGRIILVAAGKAAWQMASAALPLLPETVSAGAVITKYGHVRGPLPGVRCFEAGHPVPDENSFAATEYALSITEGLNENDTVLFLLSGGGSALFEVPVISPEELAAVTSDLLARGADIVEINTVRKRFSKVKGGRFARHCLPAKVFSVILSDVLGDPVDMIASGPTAADSSTCEDALRTAVKYSLSLSPEAEKCLHTETCKSADNVKNVIIGSVRELCRAAEKECAELGYSTVFLTDRLCCEASEAGSFLASIALSRSGKIKKTAFIAGGETVVHLKGGGLGGRNQELAFASSAGLCGLNAAVFSVGSDGTDGPTDAAGGYADGDTYDELKTAGIDYASVLSDNDSYHALEKTGGLIVTGPTGTNVNDFCCLLIE